MNVVVKDLLEAFKPVMRSRGLRIGLEDRMNQQENREQSDANSRKDQPVLLADWYLY